MLAVRVALDEALEGGRVGRFLQGFPGYARRVLPLVLGGFLEQNRVVADHLLDGPQLPGQAAILAKVNRAHTTAPERADDGEAIQQDLTVLEADDLALACPGR